MQQQPQQVVTTRTAQKQGAVPQQQVTTIQGASSQMQQQPQQVVTTRTVQKQGAAPQQQVVTMQGASPQQPQVVTRVVQGGAPQAQTQQIRTTAQPNPLQQVNIGGFAKPPEFLVHPASGSVTSGESAIFTARVVGSPRPEVFWFRADGMPLADEPAKFKITMVLGEYHQLTIVNCEQSDADTYMCVAANEGGAVQARFSLGVYGELFGNMCSQKDSGLFNTAFLQGC